MHKEIIGDCELYLGDCRDILPDFRVMDHVICDPPYEKEAHRSMRRTQESIKMGINVDLDFSAITDDLRHFIAVQSYRISQGWAMFFCQAEAVGAWRDALELAGAKYKRSMIWVKPDSSPQFNGQMPAMGYESIPLAWCGNGFAKWNGGGKRGVFTHLTNNQEREGTHQTEKPLSLMKELIGLFSDFDQSILDPFMGSGTTGVACVNFGRKFVGVEIEPKYFDIACQRIEKATRQGDLFLEKPKVKQQSFI